jgi:hypothetical protein
MGKWHFPRFFWKNRRKPWKTAPRLESTLPQENSDKHKSALILAALNGTAIFSPASEVAAEMVGHGLNLDVWRSSESFMGASGA